MKRIEVRIYSENEELPHLLEGNFFHSLELFQIGEKVPSDTPIMAVATQEGRVVGQMLAMIHRRHILIPPFIYIHAHVHGEGAYLDEETAEATFPTLLHAMTRELTRRHTLYIEFSEIQKKMFGYRHFRRTGYYPIAWQEVYNSLHSKTPEERLTDKAKMQIEAAERKGLKCHSTSDENEVGKFYQLYRNFYKMKPRRYVPPREYFEQISKSSEAKVFVTTYDKKHLGIKKASYENKILGGCTLAFSDSDAYLWHLASLRKSYRYLHPDALTVWHAIQYAHQRGFKHLHFMDVGLPWKRNPYREFIRSFGGKPVAKYRWFRCNIGIINRLMKWIYKL